MTFSATDGQKIIILNLNIYLFTFITLYRFIVPLHMTEICEILTNFACNESYKSL